VSTEVRRRRFEPWPFVLAGGLLFMISSSLAFYAVARLHPDPLVVADPFEAGLRYHALASERRAAEARGLEIRLEADLASGAALVRVDVIDQAGAPVTARSVTVRRERPAEGGLDAEFPLALDEGGFVGSIPLPRPGRWRLVVSAQVEGLTFRRVFGVRG
jgi:nitrogen fixation protein FixH